MLEPPTTANELARFLSPRTRVLLLTLGNSALQLSAPSRPPLDVRLLEILIDDCTPQRCYEGRRDAKTFLTLDAAALLDRVGRSRSVPRNLAAVAALIADARVRTHDSAREAARIAAVATSVVTNGPAASQAFSAHALVLATHGNALRADARLRDAAQLFAAARCRLPADAPSWIAGDVLALEGSLLIDSRQLDLAEAVLVRAVAAFRHSGDNAAIGRTLLKLSRRHSLAGRPELAAGVVRQALDLLHPVADARSFLYGLHNLTLEMLDLGVASTAATLFKSLAPLYDHSSDTHTSHRRLWLEARIARALGRLAAAEQGLRDTLLAFQLAGQPFFAAFVGLDLADLLLTEYRNREVAEIAASLVPLFKDQGIHSEAAAAILLFHRAAAEESLNAARLAHLRDFLLRAQVDRAARFRSDDEVLASTS